MHRFTLSRAELLRESRFALLATALLVGLFVFLPSLASSSIGWRGDYETGDLKQWTFGAQVKQQDRIVAQSAVVRQGRYAARFEVRPGDNNVAGSGSGERAEVLIPGSVTGSSEGQEAYWAWSTYFPSNFDSPPGAWNQFTQFHHSGSTGQSNVYFAVVDQSSLELSVRGGNASSPIKKGFRLASLQKGRWYDFVFHVKWSSSESVGFVEAWVNGQRVVERISTPTLYTGQAAYLKQGYYRSAYSGTTVIYHDGMRKGSSYDEVAAEFGGSSGSDTPAAGAGSAGNGTAPATGAPGTSSPGSSWTVSQSVSNGGALTGAVEWSVTPSAGPSVSRIEYSIDGKMSWTERYSPYIYAGDGKKLDTRTLSEGAHVLSVKVYAADGSSATASVNVTVANGGTPTSSGSAATPPSGTGSATPPSGTGGSATPPSGTGSATPPSGSTPTTSSSGSGSTQTSSAGASVTSSLRDGQEITGVVLWTVQTSGISVSRVQFAIDNDLVWTEYKAPYEYRSDGRLDTGSLSRGTHRLMVKVQDTNGAWTNLVFYVNVT